MIEPPITYNEFLELFPNHPQLWDKLVGVPKTVEEMINVYLPSKLWRLNNLYTIIDKAGDKVTFKLNRSQLIVYAAQLRHPRLIILKSRQQGISTYYLIDSFDDVMFRHNLSAGLMAQGREEASKLLDRIKFAWDNFDPDVRKFLNIRKIRDNSSEFAFSNDSTIFVRTSFRSATLQRLHISEYGKICNESPKKAKETKTGTLQTLAPGNVGAIESTAEGLNDFKRMWDEAVKIKDANREFAAKDFYPVFLSWLEDPTCVEPKKQVHSSEALKYFEAVEKARGVKMTEEQKNFWTVQYRELGDDIYQEYPATPEEAFRASRDGTFWSKKYNELVIRRNRRLAKLWDRNLPVYAAVDSGMHDYFVFCFFQVWGKEIRIIGEFWNHGEGLSYYASYLKEEIPKEWEVKTIYLPHDFAVRELSGNGKTRQQIWAEEGVNNTVILPKQSVETSIEQVRAELENMWIDEDCEYLEQAFLNYSKTWDSKLLKWLAEPVKNEYIHGADSIRYMVQAVLLYLRSTTVSSRGAVVDGLSL